jgi:methionyl-tRNA synthetase
MAAGIDPPAHVFVHGWLLIGGQKLSKTLIAKADSAELPVRITDVVPASLTDDFGVDPLRYYLLRATPLGTDGDFSYEGIVSRYNADLANNLGNLVSRVATVVGSKCGGVGPAPDPASPLATAAAAAVSGAVAAWERFAPHEALEATWRLITAANAELEATEP